MNTKINEANDSWDGMFPVNINKKSIPRIDLQTLYSEEEMFRVYDIGMPKSLNILGNLLVSGLIEYQNTVSPISAIHQVRIVFNRAGYDFAVTSDRISALENMSDEGYVDFPLSSVIDGEEGIAKQLGYKLVVRIHAKAGTTIINGITVPTQYYDGEIVPQDG